MPHEGGQTGPKTGYGQTQTKAEPPKRMEWGPIPANENGKGGNPPKGDKPSAIFATYHE